MSQILPWPYRILALVAMAAALFGAGWVKGLRDGADEHAEFAAQVASLGAAAEERTRATVRRQTAITTRTETTYAQGSDNLRRLHGLGRMRGPAHFGGLKLPSIPGSSGQSDGTTADAGSGTADPAADACAGLRSDAAVTTRQLLFLQDWVARQGAADR